MPTAKWLTSTADSGDDHDGLGALAFMSIVARGWSRLAQWSEMECRRVTIGCISSAV